MDKMQAIDRILGDLRLTVLEKLILIQMVKHSATDNVCSLSKTQLAEYCGSNRRSVREAMARLESEGYLVVLEIQGYTARYVPYPYSEDLIHLRGEAKPTSRLTITPEQGQYLLGVLSEKESALTLVARDAQSRHDHSAHKKAVIQVDMILDLKDTLGKFVARTVAKAK